MIKEKIVELKNKVLNNNNFWGNLLKNVITIFSGNVLASILNFVSTFIILKSLTSSNYGKIALAINYMSMIDLIVNFQSWQGVIKYGSEALEKDHNKIACISKAGLTLDFATSIMGSILGILLIPFCVVLFHWDEQVKNICILFSLEIFFHIEGTLTGLFRLYDKFKYVSIHLVLNSIIKLLVFSFLFFHKETDVIIFTLAYVIVDVIRFITYIIMGISLIHKKIGIRNLVKSKYSDLEKDFWHFTIWANLAATVDAPVKFFDTFFISLLSYELVAAYNVFKKIIHIFNMAITPISQAIMPQLSKLIASDKKYEAYHKMHKLRNLIFVIGIPVVLLLGILTPYVLRFAKKDDLIQYIWILYCQLPIYLIAYSYLGIHPLFTSYGYSKYDFFITLIANFIYIIFILITIRAINIWAIILAITIQLIITVISKEYVIKKNLRN